MPSGDVCSDRLVRRHSSTGLQARTCLAVGNGIRATPSLCFAASSPSFEEDARPTASLARRRGSCTLYLNIDLGRSALEGLFETVSTAVWRQARPRPVQRRRRPVGCLLTRYHWELRQRPPRR